MNAIQVFTAADFFKAFRNLPANTWLVWIDRGGDNQ